MATAGILSASVLRRPKIGLFLKFGLFNVKASQKTCLFSYYNIAQDWALWYNVSVEDIAIMKTRRTHFEDISMSSVLLGDGYSIYKTEKDPATGALVLDVKTMTSSCKCPVCGQISTDIHGTTPRKIQTLPLHNQPTYLRILCRKFNCNNPDCKTSAFSEELPFASSYSVRTDWLNSLILATSLFVSDEGTSTVLGMIGIKVSNDTIRRIRNGIEIEDNPDIEKIGVDDVAIRRGQTYATAVYDMEDHHLLALLDGRDGKQLRPWLQDHPKIRLVARDRAGAYASAISEILPECTQVADRFHLLQGLILHLKDIFYAEIPREILIQNGEILDTPPAKEHRVEKSLPQEELEKLDYDNSPPLDPDGSELTYDESLTDRSNHIYKEQEEKRKKNTKRQ